MPGRSCPCAYLSGPPPTRPHARRNRDHQPSPRLRLIGRAAKTFTIAAASSGQVNAGIRTWTLPAKMISIGGAVGRCSIGPLPIPPSRKIRAARFAVRVATGKSGSDKHPTVGRHRAQPPLAQKPPQQPPASVRNSIDGAAQDRSERETQPSHRLLHRCKPQCLHRRSITTNQNSLR